MRAMGKVLAVLLLCGCGCFYYGGQACASPLKNYEPGHVAVSAGGNIPTNMHFTEYDTDSKKASVYGGVTAGIGSNTALNYKYDTYKTSSDEITTNQLNLMYQFIPGLSVYGGYLHAKTDLADMDRNSNSGQIGLQGRIDIPLLFTVWGSAGYGNKLNSFEIGVSKPILNNLDVDVSYYDNRFKDLDQGGDATTRGVRAGLTIKF
ncbi:MAG: hypothetical protein VZQ81_09015 [Succiniclasticum sp.]|nr:hypothetical protein [Succiniclasticum sp.]MEE3480138.1 hypothetical protein [Succiniclasticum sp.]